VIDALARMTDVEIEAKLTNVLRAERVALDKVPTPQRRYDLSRAVNLVIYLAALHARDAGTVSAGMLAMWVALVIADCESLGARNSFGIVQAGLAGSGALGDLDKPWMQQMVAVYRARYGR